MGMAFLLIACTDRVPPGVVPPGEMANVLFDVHVADGMLATQPIDSARVKMPSLYRAIFERHGIDSAILQQSVEYYAGHPVLMKDMYVQIEARMNKLVEAEQEAINEHYRLQRQADSIRSANVSDSLRREEMFRIDAERKRYLLYVPTADTTYGKAEPVTPQTLHERLHEDIRLGETYRALYYSLGGVRQAVMPIDSTEMAVPEMPLPPSTPEDINPSPRRPLQSPETSNDLPAQRIR